MALFSNIFGGGNKPNETVINQPATPAPPTPTQAPVPDKSPLDIFNQLWEPTPAQQGTDPTQPGKIFANADPAKMLEAAKGVDFSKSINPELFTKVVAGGADAATALAQIINQVGQSAYAQAAFAATQIADRGIKQFSDGLDSRIPSTFKKLQVSDTLRNSNPAFNHPAVGPVIAALETQLAQKFPTATASEITAHAQNYLTHVAKALTAPADAIAATKTSSGDDDWAAFFADSTT